MSVLQVDYKSEVVTPYADIIRETQRILCAAEDHGLTVRLLGGMAVRLHCPTAVHRSLERRYADIDFMALKKQRESVKGLFLELGYSSRGMFNAMSGGKRLIYNDVTNGRRVDLFFDVFEMCHRLNFEHRLMLDNPTITLADLLATKLQVVEMTEREYKDIIAIIHDHRIGDSDAPETINGAYLAQLCGDDWGLYKTFGTNIINVLAALSKYRLNEQDEQTVTWRLADLRLRIERAPKSLRWKIRARIGERRPWYSLPEPDREIVIDPRLEAKVLPHVRR
jgi:hypothetical protein